ncbi:DUF4270 domain-containing protein [Marinoscillum pacificum]|uniref:DUF4270 domain-containing protein n=1 Tax=Marinoscillum pacificum TaxID=392723 RepID=UPI0021579FD1|nr:DUF4270 domain-containing protein [Marinoscillum pacificum]
MKYSYLYLIAALIISCSESSILGDEFIGDDGLDVSYIDTISLQVNTFQYDSLLTSSSDRIVLGYQTDDFFSEVKSEGYFSLSLPGSLYEIDDTDVFDSLTILIPQDGYALNIEDYTEVGLEVSRLSVELESDSYYNFSTPASTTSSKTSLVSQNVKFYIDRDVDVEVRLDDSFGYELYRQFQEATDKIESVSEFRQYLKGFQISMSADETQALGIIADSIRFRIYYTNNSTTSNAQNTLDMYSYGAPYYTRYLYEVPEELSSITELGDLVSSSSTGHASLIYGGLGYAPLISMPTLEELFLAGKDYVISGALLKIYPTESSDDLPETIYAHYVDEEFNVLSSTTMSLGLVLDDDHGRDTYYAMDVSDLVSAMHEDITAREYSIVLTLGEEYNNSFSSLWLGDEVYNSELILYTITNE